MYETSSITEKIKLFVIIFVPIFVTQISLFLMNFFNTIMSGQAGAKDLAGVAIGTSLWVPIYTGMYGILLAVTPIIAQLTGAKKQKEITESMQQAIYVAIFLGIFVIILGALLLDPVLQVMNLQQDVERIAKYYLFALSLGIIPYFIFNTLRNFMDALGRTRMSMAIILLTLPVNIVLNYIFIFGKFGLPKMGGIGAGLATAMTYWINCIIAVVCVYALTPFRSYHIFKNWKKPIFKQWKEQLTVGLPIGSALFLETSIFSAVTILMSGYGTNTIAAHQAAMNFSSLLYMIPLSVGMALTIAVGYEVGANRLKDARTYTNIGISCSLLMAVFNSVILFVFKEPVASLYHTDTEVIELTSKFLILAIFYQLADSFGAPIQGVLRGYKDVRILFFIAIVSYWLIGLPIGWIFANYTALEAFGYWIGITIGLTCGAIALLWRQFYIQKQYAFKSSQLYESRNVR